VLLRDLIARAGLDRPAPELHERPVQLVGDPRDIEVTELAYRSGDVEPGTLFFCVPGFSADGHDFAPEAVERGACALVCERALELDVTQLVVESVRLEMAPVAATFFGEPSRELDVVGVTGTNGKTTTAFLVREVLEAAGRRTGLLGTVHSVVGGVVEEVERTTPEAIDIQRTLRRMLDAGDVACAMEVSSHALELHRADAIWFASAVFTNLTQDHLDFHDTLEEYFGAKRRLFLRAPYHTPRLPVVNVDDGWGRRLARDVVEAGHPEVTTFAIQREADYRAQDVRFGADGAGFRCEAPKGEIDVRIALPGLFNVYNALGALVACNSLGIDLDTCARGLENASAVPGRFEAIDEGQEFTVIVDYAHTPDSIENVLRAARELIDQGGEGGRLILVFGAGGDRDREKRPLMGEVARALADHVIVTSDNPRSEEPEAIIRDVVAGAERAAAVGRSSQLEAVPDRRSAIARALHEARPHDVVVIAGKGHEQGQEFEGGRKVPFDDRAVVRDELRALPGSKARPAA
jgi:UDP-N-acetylmuramoyl-L-alanyl-D-glutamate--2,6-diaminopimelate ligase